ncbi:DUF6950 family protein [Proteus terrae]|uniref:DUF6950 family protein n=1 Tax=Proteus terrae TaxID=1574161 RepID=UPI00301BF6BB
MKQPNWTLKLPESIRAAMSRPFSWGEFDCCIRIISHSMIVSGQMSTTSLGKQYFYIDVREYGG